PPRRCRLAPFCQDSTPRLSVVQFKPPPTVYDKMLQLEREEALAGTMPGESWSSAPPRSLTGFSLGPCNQPERRRHPRRAGNPVPIHVRDEYRGEPVRGWVINRSQGGLGLLLEEALEIGTVVQVSPNTPTMNNFGFTVGVIYCFQERIRWRVGVQFGK